MKAAAVTIKKLAVPIDGVIGFPTVMADDWKLTSDGIESHFQKNYLGYFVLTNSLLEAMPAGSRVVLMTTGVHQEAASPKWEDVNFSVRRPICRTHRRYSEDRFGSRMERPTILSMDTHSQCLQTSSS